MGTEELGQLIGLLFVSYASGYAAGLFHRVFIQLSDKL